MPLFKDYKEFYALDLGCGVGRNSIYIAECLKNIPCTIECVDILQLAIDKLLDNANKYGVLPAVKGIVKPIEEYTIEKKRYDFILAVSALEHIDSKDSFVNKLKEINQGIRNEGIVCLVVNSEIEETNKATGEKLEPQFEVNFSTEELNAIFNNIFANWEILKLSVREQRYDTPRESVISSLKTNVATFVAKKQS